MRIDATIRFGCRVNVIAHRLKRTSPGHFVELGEEDFHLLILSNFLFETLREREMKCRIGEWKVKMRLIFVSTQTTEGGLCGLSRHNKERAVKEFPPRVLRSAGKQEGA